MTLADAAHGTVSEEVFGELLSQIFSAIVSTGDHSVADADAPITKGLPNRIPQQGRMVAGITIGGDWEGKVEVIASQQTAANLATLMHGEADPDMEDCTDALGEVANIIAGNAKGLIEGENQLGLPQVDVNEEEDSDHGLDERWTWYASLEVGLITVHLVLNQASTT